MVYDEKADSNRISDDDVADSGAGAGSASQSQTTTAVTPLPIGRWKATTYAFLPPFNYQPDLLDRSLDFGVMTFLPREAGLQAITLARDERGRLIDLYDAKAQVHYIGVAQSPPAIELKNISDKSLTFSYDRTPGARAPAPTRARPRREAASTSAALPAPMMPSSPAMRSTRPKRPPTRLGPMRSCMRATSLRVTDWVQKTVTWGNRSNLTTYSPPCRT